MDLSWSAKDIRFREEVRDVLADRLTADLHRVGKGLTSVYATFEVAMAWQTILQAKGWVAPAWPVEWGGCD